MLWYNSGLNFYKLKKIIMSKLSFNVNIPVELEEYRNDIIIDIKIATEYKIASIISKYKHLNEQKRIIQKCDHVFKTTYERTSAYDSEYVTQCTKCKAYKSN